MSAPGILRGCLQEAHAANAHTGPGLVSRNIRVQRHRTSIRLEASMWDALKEICRREGLTLNEVCTFVAASRSPALTLTAALRAVIANYFRDAATEEGHARAAHGRRTVPPIGAARGSTRTPNAGALAVTPAE
jgi:predicted DNA-binding ribbon-helix-helix protein